MKEGPAIRSFLVFSLVALGCGGKVVFVEDDGAQGGSPSSFGGSPSSFGGSPSSFGGSPSFGGSSGDGGSIGVGVPVTECQLACTTIFQCGLQPTPNGMLLCPGFQPGDQTAFVTGCAATCEDTPALISLVDPNDCQGTIETLQAVSVDFSDTCAFGL